MMTTTTSFFGSLSLNRTPFLYPSPSSSYSPPHPLSFSIHSIPRGKRKGWGREVLFVRVNCVSERSKGTAPAQSESETESPSPSSLYSSSTSTVENAVADDDTGFLTYKWCAALGGVGFVETVYLAYLKLSNSEAFCPMGGGSCTTILTSDYSSVFGVPLPLFGMLAYGLVAILGLQLSAKEMTSEAGRMIREMILLGTTTSMAVASAYFLYILSTEFVGELCLYCLASAGLSFTLFFTTLKNAGSHKIQKMLGSQLVIAGLVVIALTASYNTAQPVSSSLAEIELPYTETEITKESSPVALSLARHLRSIGAKLYGAFWCSHCQDQKEMFGREAAKLLDYVECFPDGVKKGTKMAQACLDVKLQGFPTWVIKGQVLSGEKQLSELANLSGIELQDLS